MHNKTIKKQKRGKTAMQIKITVDIDNTDILKFFELFKKDLATVAKNTTVETAIAENATTETVTEQQPKNDNTDFSAEKQPKKSQKKQPKNDCADFSGVQQAETSEEKSDNGTVDNSTDNSTDNNSLEHEFNFNAAPVDAKIEIVKNMLVTMAKSGRKTEAKEILTKNKVPALSKLCDAEEKILVKIYNEVKNAQQ